MDYAKRIELLEQNIKRMKEERARLKEQNGKEYLASQIEKGGDIYDRYETHENTTQIRELDERIKEAEAELKKLVDEQILTNSQTLYEEGQREREQAIQDYNATAKYTYTAGGEEHKTNNPALAARYDAQHRFFGMSKTKQAMAKMTGQWKKFDKLWNKSTDDLSLEEQEEIAKELNSMFRKK